MNRNSKPFSVEIKKSRVPGQRSQLPPRRLFAPLPSDPAKVLQKETFEAVDEPMAAPRILPSILAPVPDLSETVSSVRRKRSSIKSDREQMGFDLNTTVAANVGDILPAAPGTAEDPLQAEGAPVVAEETTSFDDVQHPAQGDGPEDSARTEPKMTPERAEPAVTSEFISQPELAYEPEVGEPIPMEQQSQNSSRRLTKRQRAAAQLPRHERWKRRLHSAAW